MTENLNSIAAMKEEKEEKEVPVLIANQLGQVVKLSVLNKLGRASPAEYHIMAEKQSGQWVFGATLRCLTDAVTSIQ